MATPKTHDYIVRKSPRRKSAWNLIRRYDGFEETVETFDNRKDADRAARILNEALRILREEFSKLKNEEEDK
jgi:hypothetical protein